MARTPLHEAAEHGRLLEVETLLSGVGQLEIPYEKRIKCKLFITRNISIELSFNMRSSAGGEDAAARGS